MQKKSEHVNENVHETENVNEIARTFRKWSEIMNSTARTLKTPLKNKFEI